MRDNRGIENVWDYPRPPALVPCWRRVLIKLDGELLADSARALRVLETSHPPTVYVPPDAIALGLLQPSQAHGSWCEFKGAARYLDAVVGGVRHGAIGWSYPDPAPRYAALKDHVAFYPGRVQACLDDERVQAQEGDFYGGWITAELLGPFKGGPGTLGW